MTSVPNRFAFRRVFLGERWVSRAKIGVSVQVLTRAVVAGVGAARRRDVPPGAEPMRAARSGTTRGT